MLNGVADKKLNLDETWQSRTKLLLDIAIIFIFFSAGGWSLFFLKKGNITAALVDLIPFTQCIIAFALLRRGLINFAAHQVLSSCYIYIVVTVVVLEGVEAFPFNANHFYLISLIPGVFIFLYSASRLVRYFYAFLFVATFIFFEYHLWGITLPAHVDLETHMAGKSFVVIMTALLVTLFSSIFVRQVERTEIAVIEVNDDLEKIVKKLLPERIAEKLRLHEESQQDRYAECTILVSDLVGFTPLTMTLPPEELLNLLNDIFERFDNICEKLGLEKIKTIGDAYILAGGIPDPLPNHAEAVAEAALNFLNVIQDYDNLDMRIGIHSGEVSGGILGKKRFIYDIWGPAVSIASEMESSGVSGSIHVSEDTYRLLKKTYLLQKHGVLTTEWGAQIKTYILESQRDA